MSARGPVLAALVLAALATGCGKAPAPAPAPSSPAASAPTEQPAPTPAADPGPIAGEYRVAGIDGEPVAGAMGIAVSIGADSVAYEPRCLGFVWRYRRDGGAIALTRDPAYAPAPKDGGAPVTCLPAVTPAFGQLAAAFDAARLVRRTPAGGVEVSGGGHSVLLFSQ